MKAKVLSRTLVVLILGMALALGRHQLTERYRAEGREAFVAEQSQRWDQFYSHPHHLAIGIVVGISATVFVFGVYELLVAAASRLLKGLSSDDNRSK